MIPGYELTAELANFGLYRLFRGLRQEDAAPVLVKLPRNQPVQQSDVAALERESAMLETLPAEVAHFVGLIRLDRGCALVLEDSDGVLLSELCESRPPDLGASLTIATKLATALAQLHRRDIIHGGLSPHGVLVDPQTWCVQLIDLSRANRVSAETRAIFDPELSLRTLTYASPEQTGRMNRAVDYRTDFYSLGIILYELLTGRPRTRTRPYSEAPRGAFRTRSRHSTRALSSGAEAPGQDGRRSLPERPGFARGSRTLRRRVADAPGDSSVSAGDARYIRSVQCAATPIRTRSATH